MMISVVFFGNFEIISFCFVVAICGLVYDVETIFHFPYVLKALCAKGIWKPFLKYE